MTDNTVSPERRLVKTWVGVGSKTAVLEVPVSIGLFEQMGEENVQALIAEQHRGDWEIRGPRGGRYIAPAGQVTTWQWDRSQFWVQGAYRLLGRRHHMKYVRPRRGATP